MSNMYEKFAAVIHREELTSAEGTMLEELVALANSSSGQFIRKESGSLVNTTLSETVALSGLSDVAFSGLASGDLLSYNGSTWQNTAVGLEDLDNVAISNPQTGQFLKFLNDRWVNSTDISLGSVTSVSVTTANGVSGSVATATTTPAITLTLGSITPSAVQISGLTASEIVITDASKNLASAAVATYPSLTELAYVKGVTSAIQTQFTSKANLATPVFTSKITMGVAAGSTGSLELVGTTSGVVTVKVADAAGTYTLTLPTTDGDASQFLQTNGSGVLTWASGGAGDMILASVQSVTGLKTFDDSKFAMKGSSTGIVTVATANAGASNYIATFQAATGTVAYQADVTYIGTTSVALNRASAALVLTGITSIDGSSASTTGNAATVTNGVYTTGAGSVYAVGSTGLAGGQTIAGSTLTTENLTLRANAADLTTGAVIVSSSKEASSATVGSVQLAGGLAVAKRVYALDMTVTNTITGTTSGNLVSGGALGTPSSGTGTNITGIPAANILAGSFGAGAYVISTSLQAATIELGHATQNTLSASSGVLSIEGVAVLTVAGGTLTGSITLGENTGIALDPAGSADGKWSGVTIAGVGGATIAFGRLVYLKAADSRWWETDADATATGGPVMLGMTVTSTTAGAAVTVLLIGQIRADASFPALTIGAPVYVGETAGDIQVAIPTGADNVIRVVGFALTADEIYFNPSQDHQITVA